MIRHAYLNADDVVVQVAVGGFSDPAHDLLLADYRVLFGAVRCVPVEDDTIVIWIGGTYTDGTFISPPAPEPLPEPLPEVITETII